ncbi:hypothetical protein Q0M94_10005 [Deinococcus radiomollis]|uniref:hypothetical protein n=1 Tax=Deinococcus radiomollis TaxID=468916 RepID=UPI003891C102
MYTAAQIQVGLRVVSALLGTLVVLYLLSFLIGLLTSGFHLIQAAQTAFMVWMCWSCYIGKVWARTLLALLLVIFGIAAVVAGLHWQGGVGTVVLILGILEIVGGVSLFAIPQVNAYFEYVAQQGS